MPIDAADMIKIAAAVVSVVVIYLFRKKITDVVSDLIVGGDAQRYKGEASSDIIQRVENRLNEVLR